MSSPPSTPLQSPSLRSEGTSSPTSNLNLESLQTARSEMTHYWKRKTIPMAIAVGVLPILGLGVLNFSMGRHLLNRDPAQNVSPPLKQTAQSWLTLLLIGASATALLTGGLAWLWLKVFVNALVKQSTQLVAQADQSQISESLQDLGRTIGLLQEQDSIQKIVETAAVEVRSLFKTDRALVFFSGDVSTPAIQSEDQASGQAALLTSDLSHLSLSLEDLFKVPMGYVQVCSEVEGSDLPKSHQSVLTELSVQAQMVTQITQDNQSKGLLVVQCSSPRDWTEVEHQLFAAIAKQIAIALERKTTQPAPVAVPTPSPPAGEMQSLWSSYHNHCFQLAQSSGEQAHRLKQVIEQLQAGLDSSQMLGQGLHQVQDHIHNHTQIFKNSEMAVNRSMTSITQMQETLAQSSHSSEQLIDLGQKIAQVSVKIKDLANRVNYQAMNASIVAKKQGELDQSWSFNFTNEVLQLTRALSRQTSEIETLSSQVLAESHSLATAADMGSEQLLVSAEWFRDSRQQWNQMVAVNGKLEASLRRLIDSYQERERNTIASHQQIVEVAHWLNQTVEESGAMVQSIEQLTSRALA